MAVDSVEFPQRSPKRSNSVVNETRVEIDIKCLQTNTIEPAKPFVAEFISTKRVHFQFYKGSYYPKKFD